MTNKELIQKAASVINPVKTDGGLIGDVGCAIIADNDKVYTGICAATGSNVFCAEQNAIGSMITDKQFGIKKIVATWKDEKGIVFVIPPCGNCRQLMREINEDNLEKTEVLLDIDKEIKLKELLPYYDLWQKIG